MAGWPAASGLALLFKNEVTTFACESGLLTQTDAGLTLGPKADTISSEASSEFLHLQQRFHQSLTLRIRRNYQQLNDSQAQEMASEIEFSLVRFFREAGLSLATTLLSNETDHHTSPVPLSILMYVN